MFQNVSKIALALGFVFSVGASALPVENDAIWLDEADQPSALQAPETVQQTDEAARVGCRYVTVYVPGTTTRQRICTTIHGKRVCKYQTIHIPGGYKRVRVCP